MTECNDQKKRFAIIKFKVLEGKLQTYLPKDVGVNTTPQMKMLEKIDIRIIRIDLAGVTRAESAGLALLLEWQRVAEQRGTTIAYVNMPAQMQSMAAVCGLEEILQSA